MPVLFEIPEHPRPWVRLTLEGIVTAQEVVEGMGPIPEAPGFAPGLDGLCDASPMSDFRGGAMEIVKLADFYQEMQERAEWNRWAVVAPQAHIYGLVLMWQTYANIRHRGAIKVFRDLEGAQEWLGVGPIAPKG